MKGHLRQRGKSKIWYAVWDDYRAGRRQRRWTNLHTTSKREAHERLAKLMTDWAEGKVAPAGRWTVEDQLTAWLASRETVGLAPRSIQRYRETIEMHIVPTIGRIQLSALTPKHLERLYALALKDGLAPSTVLRMHATIRAALHHAMRQGMVPRNVAELVSPPRVHPTEQQVLSPEQVATLLETLRASRHRLYALYYIAVSTGMRQGELIGLRWGDVDLRRQRIHVRVQRQYLPGQGIVERPTKEHRGTRVIELTDAEVAVLRAHRERMAEERRKLTERFGVDVWQSDLVFGSGVGTPINPRNLYRGFKAILAKAKLPDVRFHDLRHTAATLMLSADGRVLVASRRLGHADPATTAKMYGHVLEGDQREAAERAMRRVLEHTS